MPIRLAILFIIACAITAVLAAPRVDFVCAAGKAINLNSENHARWSCMHYAAARGDTSVIRRMLDYGADIDQRNAAGRTPLAEAAKSGQLKAVKLLLDEGAEVNIYDTESGFTPLHSAAQKNHPAVVRRLLAAGANVNARNQWNQTPLWQAAWQAWHGNTEIAHILIAHGAEIDVPDEKGHTPLAMAARSGHAPMVDYLLEQGADVTAANDKGRTPLYQAVIGDHLEVAALLLKHGADPNAQVGDWTPLRAALEDDHLEMADLLHANGAHNYEQLAADARLDKGYRLLKNEQFDGAIKAFDSAIALSPENSRAYYYRGLAFYREGQNHKALNDLQQAVTLDRKNTDALESLGAIYTDLGSFQAAGKALNELVELRPDYGRGYFLLSKSHRGQGEYEQAKNWQSRACDLGYQPACAQ